MFQRKYVHYCCLCITKAKAAVRTKVYLFATLLYFVLKDQGTRRKVPTDAGGTLRRPNAPVVVCNSSCSTDVSTRALALQSVLKLRVRNENWNFSSKFSCRGLVQVEEIGRGSASHSGQVDLTATVKPRWVLDCPWELWRSARRAQK